MPEFILTRTDQPPAKITGTKLAALASSNADVADKAASNKQWFVVDLFRTEAGTLVVHALYRAGSKLGREEPVDAVFTGKSGELLMAKLDAVNVEAEFVSGWPNDRDEKYQQRHDTVCDYADRQWRDVCDKIRAIVIGEEPSEEII